MSAERGKNQSNCVKMSVNDIVEQWLFEYASRHCLHRVLSGNKIVLSCDNWQIASLSFHYS